MAGDSSQSEHFDYVLRRRSPLETQEFELVGIRKSAEMKGSHGRIPGVRCCARNRPIPIWPANNTDDATPGTVPCCPQDHASTMHTRVDDVHTLDELRQFIYQTLCAKENLLADQFTMTEVRLNSGSGPCGIQFCLRGPRDMRLAAIWVADGNVVYLYDARGMRYAKLRLRNGLAMTDEARAA
jgi:hypothetical protein